MKFSIITPTYKKSDLTKACLKSIFENTVGDFEVIVIDDNSGDDTRDVVGKFPNVKYIQNNTNLGFSKNNNKGADVATGDILIFLNNDTEVHPGWLESLESVFNDEQHVGAVGAKLLFPDGTVQHAGVAVSEDKVPRHIYYQGSPSAPYVKKRRDLQIVTAACIAIPKKVFSEIGGFDESYVNGMEDVDLCLRLREKGYRVIYEPRCVVTHHESVSPGRHLKNKQNADLYMKKWGDKVVPDEHQIYREDGFGWWYILSQDLRHMAYADNNYGKKPWYVSVLKYIYIPIQKIALVLSLVFKGDFKTLGEKIKKVTK